MRAWQIWRVQRDLRRIENPMIGNMCSLAKFLVTHFEETTLGDVSDLGLIDDIGKGACDADHMARINDALQIAIKKYSERTGRPWRDEI